MMRQVACPMLAGCVTQPTSTVGTNGSHAAVGNWGVDLSMIDESVKPGEDFFAYANGKWLKTAEIPADRSYAGVNYELNRQNEDRLKAIVADIGKSPDAPLTPEARKLRDLFAAYSDTTGIEAQAMARAQADLAMIARLTTRTQIAEAMSDPVAPTENCYLAPDARVHLW